jgi:hypothetical protein
MFIHFSFIPWLGSCDVGSLSRLFASSFVHRPFINDTVNERNTKSMSQIHGSYKPASSSTDIHPDKSVIAISALWHNKRLSRVRTGTARVQDGYRNALQLVDNQWCVFAAKISGPGQLESHARESEFILPLKMKPLLHRKIS